mgnify:CR=1 FL=1
MHGAAEVLPQRHDIKNLQTGWTGLQIMRVFTLYYLLLALPLKMRFLLT